MWMHESAQLISIDMGSKEHDDIICRNTERSHKFGIFYGNSPHDFDFATILLEMSIVMVISHAVRFILKPLRQPKVISEIIAGIIIGPSVLGHNKSFQSHVFPRNSQFVVRNIGLIGFMYFLFVSGVKMDLGVIKKAGKKQWSIALVGVILPHVILLGLSFSMRKHMDKEMAKPSTIGGIASALIITTFPVIYTVLRDLNLLSSEIGRLALSTVIISDVIGLNIVVAFEAVKQGEGKSMNALYYVVSLIFVCGVVVGGIPKVMGWIKQRTPEGKSVDQRYVTVILLGVFMISFVTDFIGAAIANGPLWLGLAIPDGPPIGATLVEKTEVFMSEVLAPFSFASMGLLTDTYEMSLCWSCLGPLFFISLTGYLSKLGSIMAAAHYNQMPFKEGLTLGLMMSLRGQVEFLLFLHWMDWKMVDTAKFTMMVFLTIMVTGISSPLISILYDPTRPYMTNRRRTVQHNGPNSELRIVACIHDEECVTNLFSLLQVSNPSITSPFFIYALNLIELVGRASPILIDHSLQPNEYWDSYDEAIHNALRLYQDNRGSEIVKVEYYTSVAPHRTMYQDICELALERKASLIIMPFHRKTVTLSGDTVVRRGVQSINSNCLLHAPCSVGIFVSKNSTNMMDLTAERSSGEGTFQCAMIFLGGADAREALAYADRIAGDPDVNLLVVRFLVSSGGNTDYSFDGGCSDRTRKYYDMERKLDDGVVTWFWVKNERNQRVVYKEIVVSNGNETISAIYAMNEDDRFDLWIVGRKNGIHPVLLHGLSTWSENHELGVIGDYLTSDDFNTNASVLVIQQQMLRDHYHKRYDTSIDCCKRNLFLT